jgi:hypothetical protein
MHRAHRSPEYLEFRALLYAWMKVVDYYARRRQGRQPVSAREYPALHGNLLNACRAQLSAPGEMEQQAAERLIELIGPWVTLESLSSARRQILTDLSAQCLAVEYVLDGRTVHAIPWARIALAGSLVLFAVLLVALARMGGSGDDSLAALLDRGQRSAREVVWAIRYADFLEKFIGVTALIVTVGILLLTRGLKKWS